MKNRFSFNSITFIAIVSAYFSFMLNVKFWQFAFDKIDITSVKVAVFAFGLPFFMFIPLFCFFSLITLPRVGKPLIMLLLVLSAASDYALQNLGIDKACLKQQAETKAFSHDNYFHSVLHLLSVKSTAYERSLDIFEKCER
ncbi:MAG: DUF1705 domain-containing protein [Alphaproteobacteria bacterium]|nr:DUF1705 domain-containing protein [Alphaproteobacteria bacterium]